MKKSIYTGSLIQKIIIFIIDISFIDTWLRLTNKALTSYPLNSIQMPMFLAFFFYISCVLCPVIYAIYVLIRKKPKERLWNLVTDATIFIYLHQYITNIKEKKTTQQNKQNEQNETETSNYKTNHIRDLRESAKKTQNKNKL